MVKLQSICYAWIWVLPLNTFKYKVRKPELKATYKWAMAAVVSSPQKAVALLGLEVTSISVFKTLDIKIIHDFSLKTFILLVCQLWHLTLISELTNSALHFSYHKLDICLWPDSTYHTMLSTGCWPFKVTHSAQFLSLLLTTHDSLYSKKDQSFQDSF